jgi:peptidyl-prolyl cis-trans isomerase-like 1
MPAPESVILETSLGNIQLELYWNHAPRVCLLLLRSRARLQQSLKFGQTCENFAQLAKRGYYNGVIFHRIIPVRP